MSSNEKTRKSSIRDSYHQSNIQLMLEDLSINHKIEMDALHTNFGQVNVAFERLLSTTPNLVSF